jgi:hypothetical protein
VLCCDNLTFSGEVKMSRKHTVPVPGSADLIYRMLSQVEHENIDRRRVRGDEGS